MPQTEYDINLIALKNSVQYALYKPLKRSGLVIPLLSTMIFFNVDIVARMMELERDPRNR